MANSLSSLNPEYWAAAVQETLWVNNTAMYVADTTVVNLVNGNGDTINFPILSHPGRATYTPGTDLSLTTMTASNEQLSIATWSAAAVRYDDTEKKQSIYALGSQAADQMMRIHKNTLEQAVLAEVTNATHTIDAGNVGGTAGNNIVVTTDNVPNIFTAAGVKLDAYDAPKAGRTAIVGTHFLQQLMLQQANRWTSMGDTVNAVGRIGQLFNWEIIENNNLPFTAVLSIVTQPTDGDTVTLAGVTVTGHQTLIATAWFDIRTNVDTTRTFLRDLINYGNGTGGTVAGTVGTDFTDVSSDNRFIWQKRGLLAVDDASADTLTITGYGDITVSETLADATDGFTSARQDAFFLVKGSPKLAVQIPPMVEVDRDPDQFADIVKSLLGYGKKTTADAARKMVRVKVNALPSADASWS